MTIYPGSLVRLTARFTNKALEQPIDPSGVCVRCKAPSGSEANYYAVNDAPGRYHYDLMVTEAGKWFYRWEATGTQSADEGFFYVHETEFPNPAPPYSNPPYPYP